MLKKLLKITAIVLGSVLILIVLLNIGFSLWLKYKLPDYLKTKTPYEITYQSLNVEILSGSISAKEIKIKTKNPYDKKTLGLEGSLKALQISRLGVWDLIKNKQINTKLLKLETPNILVSIPQKDNSKKRDKKNPINLQNLEIEKGNIIVENSEREIVFSARDLQLNIEDMEMNQNQNSGLPFGFKKYSFAAKNLLASPGASYNITADDIFTKDNKLRVNNFAMLPKQDFSVWKVQNPTSNNQISIKVPQILVDGFQLQKNKISFSDFKLEKPVLFVKKRKITSEKSKSDKNALYFDFQNITALDLSFVQMDENNNVAMSIPNANVTLKGLKRDEEILEKKQDFEIVDYHISGNNFFYDTGDFYKLDLKSFDIKKDKLDLESFVMKPKVSRDVFVKKIPMEKDLFDITIKRIRLSGIDWKIESGKPNVRIQNLDLNTVDANIFRSKIPKDDPKEKLLYSKLLRAINFPLLVDNLNLIRSKLVYEEDKPDANGPGKVIFTNFDMSVKNLNSNKGVKNTKVPIDIKCNFFDASPMNVKWILDTADLHDNFTISGQITELPAEKISPFIKPYLNITATGKIKNLLFDFKGNNDVMKGKFSIKHEDLKVNLLDKKTQKKKNFLSAIANLVVKKKSNPYPDSVDVDITRNKQRSFFNEFWKGIEDGLKKTLLIVEI